MKTYYSKNVLAEVSVKELQLMRRCISSRIGSYSNYMNDQEQIVPEDAQEMHDMEMLYLDITKMLQSMPF